MRGKRAQKNTYNLPVHPQWETQKEKSKEGLSWQAFLICLKFMAPAFNASTPIYSRTAIVLLSGGLDSATVLAIASSEGYAVTALSFSYGQRHGIELDFAKRLAREHARRHLIIRLDPQLFLDTALVGDKLEVPDYADSDAIPVTYVPGRNILFLAHALSLAESTGAEAIFLGINALDYSGYPDCRPEFIEAFSRMAGLGTKAGVEGRSPAIRAPLISWTKARIIKEGMRLGVDYGLTSSCYNPDGSGRPCGRCDSCHLRAKGFAEAGFEDPIIHRNSERQATIQSPRGPAL